MLSFLMNLLGIIIVIKLIAQLLGKFITKMMMFNMVKDYYTRSDPNGIWKDPELK